MAKPKHIDKFYSGVEVWNKWRAKYPRKQVDLSRLEVTGAPSRLARLGKPGVNREVFGIFRVKDYHEINLQNTNLAGVVFSEIDFTGADFRGANLAKAQFRQVLFADVKLDEANLQSVHFLSCKFLRTSFERTILGHTHFGFSPMLDSKKAENIITQNKIQLDFLTLYHSNNIPPTWLQAAGISLQSFQWIQHLRSNHKYKDCFISFSSQDQAFVLTLRAALIHQGVPCWYAHQDLRLNFEGFTQEISDYELGHDLFTFIDACDVFLLVLSPNSLRSKWVKEEIERSSYKKRIIPLLLEDIHSETIPDIWQSLKTSSFIDFRQWKTRDHFLGSLQILLARITA